MTLLLASASPRRRDLLAAAGIACDVVPMDVDERTRPDETPSDYVRRLAVEKASAAAAVRPEEVVLGADTAVVVDGVVFGKPADAADAARMLRVLSGRAHEVLTGYALVAGRQVHAAVERTTVWLAPLTEADIAGYVATGEPMGKAGAYAIQGRASRFVTRIEGSYTNVVGLPVAQLVAALAAWPEVFVPSAVDSL